MKTKQGIRILVSYDIMIFRLRFVGKVVPTLSQATRGREEKTFDFHKNSRLTTNQRKTINYFHKLFFMLFIIKYFDSIFFFFSTL